MSIEVVGPSPNRSHCCHSINSAPQSGSMRAQKMRLPSWTAYVYSQRHHSLDSQSLRQQAHHALAPRGGLVERIAPPLPDVDARPRVDVEEDLVRQPRVLPAEPLLERDRFAVVDAGVAEEYSGYRDHPLELRLLDSVPLPANLAFCGRGTVENRQTSVAVRAPIPSTGAVGHSIGLCLSSPRPSRRAARSGVRPRTRGGCRIPSLTDTQTTSSSLRFSSSLTSESPSVAGYSTRSSPTTSRCSGPSSHQRPRSRTKKWWR